MERPLLDRQIQKATEAVAEARRLDALLFDEGHEALTQAAADAWARARYELFLASKEAHHLRLKTIEAKS